MNHFIRPSATSAALLRLRNLRPGRGCRLPARDAFTRFQVVEDVATATAEAVPTAPPGRAGAPVSMIEAGVRS